MIFCRHNWEVVSETTTKSRIEVLHDLGCTSLTGRYNLGNLVDRKVILVVQCVKCGKLKKFVEEV